MPNSLGRNLDIDDTVTLGDNVTIRDNVNLRYVIVEDDVKIGRNAIIFGSASHPAHIGRGAYISPNCYINGAFGLKIGVEATLSAGVMIFSDSGPNGGPLKKVYPTVEAPITIGDGAWVCAGSVLLPGAGLEPASVLAANSTLKDKVGRHELWGGNIAKLIKTIDVQE
jgi:acetyltransferase-like isoleucine patch superfamily enzyme